MNAGNPTTRPQRKSTNDPRPELSLNGGSGPKSPVGGNPNYKIPPWRVNTTAKLKYLWARLFVINANLEGLFRY